ncbi:MAG: LacI family DNA-binding transcriptional regulator [Bacteroidota bacterium]
MKKLHKTKLKDIAQEAKVSVALVSYVLNGRHSGRIKKETADKIKAIAKRLDYHTNSFAKGLRTQKSNTIGLILADLANPFSAQIARIIEDKVMERGYILLIGSMDEDISKFRRLIDTFIKQQVEGLLIVPSENSIKEIEDIQRKGISCVLIDRYFPSLSFNYVANDNYFSTYTCVMNMIENGKKTIGFITQKTDYFHFHERRRGFDDACREAGVDVENRVREVDKSDLNNNVERAISELLDENPGMDAILFSTNMLTLHGLKYAIRNNLNVPDQIEIMGFDEVQYYDIFPVPISYFKQPLEQIGHKAVEYLIAEIDNPGQPPLQQVIKGELVMAAQSGVE